MICLEVEKRPFIVDVLKATDPILNERCWLQQAVQAFIPAILKIHKLNEVCDARILPGAQDQVPAVVGDLAIVHPVWLLLIPEDEGVVVLLGAHSMVVDLLVLKLVRLLPSLGHVAGVEGLWSVKAGVEEPLVVVSARDGTELYPLEYIELQVLASLSRSHVNRGPIRAPSLHLIRHILPIRAPALPSDGRCSVRRQLIWIQEHFRPSQRVLLAQPIAMLLLDPTDRALVAEATIVQEIVMLSLLVEEADLWIVPLLGYLLFELVSQLALAQELFSDRVLAVHPRLGGWRFWILKEPVGVSDFGLGASSTLRRIEIHIITSWS